MDDFRAGKKVIVGHDLYKTYRFHGEDRDMEQMKGKIYEIKDVPSEESIILKHSSKTSYYFHPHDLTLIDDDTVEIIYPDPVSFDPDNLVM